MRGSANSGNISGVGAESCKSERKIRRGSYKAVCAASKPTPMLQLSCKNKTPYKQRGLFSSLLYQKRRFYMVEQNIPQKYIILLTDLS